MKRVLTVVCERLYRFPIINVMFYFEFLWLLSFKTKESDEIETINPKYVHTHIE